jgi:hypothetical protein
MRLCWCRWSDFSTCRKAMWTLFLRSGIRKKRLERINLSDVLSRRTHNLTSGRPKKRFWWSRWSDFSSFWKAIRSHFQHPEHRKLRIEWIRLRFKYPMTQRTHNLFSECLKMRLYEAMFLVVERPFERIFYTEELKKRFGLCCVSGVLSMRMALRTHYLPSGRLKKRLC